MNAREPQRSLARELDLCHPGKSPHSRADRRHTAGSRADHRPLVGLACVAPVGTAETPRHELAVAVEPAAHTLRVIDTLRPARDGAAVRSSNEPA